MSRIQSITHRVLRWRHPRGWILLPCSIWILVTGCLYPDALEPTAGLDDFRSPLRIVVPGGQVDVAGGNLVIRRIDFSIDTRLGKHEVGATYNSARRNWIWSFELGYDGTTFTDGSGAVHDVSQLADGQAIPGTHWRKVDAHRIRTKGGLVHHFGPGSARLARISLGDAPYPFLAFVGGSTAVGPRTVSVVQCVESWCSNVYGIDYDENGCVSGLNDRAGRSASFVNDPQCNPSVARDPLDQVKGWSGRRYEYELGQLTSATNSEGVRFEYAYLDGHLMTAYAPQRSGAMMTFSYGFAALNGLYFTRITDSSGGVRLLHYDDQRRLHTFLDPVGGVTRFEWDGLRPISVTDPAGEITRWEYLDDDPVRITRPDGNVIAITYEPRGINHVQPLVTAAASVRDAMGPIESRTFNSSGQLTALFTGSEFTNSFGYSVSGELVFTRNSRGEPTYLSEYGEHGHAEWVQKNGFSYRRRFDDVGNLLAGPDFEGAVAPARSGIVSRAFDADRNLVTLELEGGTQADPLAKEPDRVDIEYRSDGRPVRIFRPYGGDTRFDYDAAGQLVARSERVDGVWQSILYGYSAVGQMTSSEWPNGMRHEVDHDPLGRPVALRLLRDGVVEKSLLSTWEAGRLVSRSDTERPGVERIFYDSVGRVSAIHFPEGEVLERNYDKRGREVERVYRLSEGSDPLRTVSFVHDSLGRIVEWRDQGDLILQRTYDEGRLTEETNGNGLVRSFEYVEDSGLLWNVITVGPAGSSLYVETEHSWRECGALHLCVSLLSIVEPGPGASFGQIFPEEGYRLDRLPGWDDGLDHAGARLESWGTYALFAGPYEGAGEYGFDSLGNWLGTWLKGDAVARFTYNGEHNRLLAADLDEQYVYSWDEAGFMLSRNQESIEWDAGGRPTVVGADWEIEWDTLGRLVSVRSGEQISRTLFGGRVRGDSDRNPLSLDLNEVEIDLVSDQRLYRHSDIRGNVQFVSNDEGVIERYYQYSPFGVFRAWGDGTDRVSFAQGREWGDYLWLGGRLYDPDVGRFLSPDPKYQILNQFSYTLGNPFFFWDPAGLHEVPSPASNGETLGMRAAGAAENIGYLAFAGGVATSSIVLAAVGITIVVSSVALQWSLSAGCECVPNVEIEDLPDSYELPEGAKPKPSSGSKVTGESTSCSPQVLHGESRGVHWGVLWLPLQALLVTGFLRFRRNF